MGEPKPPLLVPSLLWGENSSHILYKVPFHTFVGTAKKRQLQLKPATADLSTDDGSIDVAIVSGDSKKSEIVKAAFPLALVWGDPKSSEEASLHSSHFTPSFLSSRKKEENEILLRDIERIASGTRTDAFQAFIAKNGRSSIPPDSCCFSIVGSKRSVDFFVASAGGNVRGRDMAMANAWRESLQSLLDRFQQIHGTFHSMLTMAKHWDSYLHRKSLFDAAKCGDIETLRWFFDRGCPIDCMDSTTGDTVLMVACRLGHYDVARLALIQYHARNDPHPDFGQTALQVAVSSGHLEIVRLLLLESGKSGSDKVICNHEGENGEAPIHVAARCGSIEIMELLLLHGADLGLVDGRGRTCLHWAAQASASCLECALEAGADEFLEVRDDSGLTCLHLAIRANKAECVEILLNAGADVTAELPDGSTSYDLASKQRSQGITKLLLEYDMVPAGESYGSLDLDPEDDCSSLSGGDNMFSGLNTYSREEPKQVDDVRSAETPFSMNRGVVRDSMMVDHRLSSYRQLHSHWSPGGTQLVNTLHPAYQLPHHIYPEGFASNTFQSDDAGQVETTMSWFESSMQYEGEEFDHDGCKWKIFITHDGYPYFYNINLDTSTWEDPRENNISFGSMQNVNEQQSAPHVVTPSMLTLTSSAMTTSQNAASELVAKIPEQVGEIHFRRTDDSIRSDKQSIMPQQTKATAISSAFASKEVANPSLSREMNEEELKSDLLIDAPSMKKGLSHSGDLTSEDHNVATKGDGNNELLIKKCKLDKLSAMLEQRQKHHAESNKITPDENANRIETKNTTTTNNNNTEVSAASKNSTVSQRIPNNNDVGIKKSESPPPSKGTNSLETKSTTNSERTDDVLEKFRKMLSVGEPLPAVCHKMAQERISIELIEKFTNETNRPKESDKPAEADVNSHNTKTKPKIATQNLEHNGMGSPKSNSSDQLKNSLIDDEALKKYAKMLSVGIPGEADVFKMKQQGIKEAKISNFKECHGLLAANTPLSAPPPSTKPIPTFPDNKMKKENACIATKDEFKNDKTLSKYVKMSEIGVPPNAVVLQMQRDGIDEEKIEMFKAAFGLDASSTSRPSGKRLPMPPLPKERRRSSRALQKIHWNTVDDEKLKNSLWAAKSNDGDESDINESAIQTLESLFASSPGKTGSTVRKTTGNQNVNKKTSLIDPKRSNNIAISLAQFRDFNDYKSLCRAVESLDSQHLDAENLQNMQMLLPTPEETNRLKHCNGQTDGLGRAELFFLAVMETPRFANKLACFKFLLQFDDMRKTLTSSMEILEKACEEVIGSKKLAGLLKRLLAIGNLMNSSTGKPEASGITLDSLIKTASKKGSDGKTTVLSTALSGKLDLVDFSSDMPTIRHAMRLDLDDFRSTLRELEAGVRAIECAINAEKSDTNSECSQQFLNRLEPFHQVAAIALDKIRTEFQGVEERVQSLCSFFAEDFNSCKASSIFTVLLEFASLVEKSIEQHRRREKAERRRQRKC